MLCLATALPAIASAQTTTVRTAQDLKKLSRKSKLAGSWVIGVPGQSEISLPRLTSVEGRLDFAMTGLRGVDLPALESVGADLFIGCDAPLRDDWATLGPIRPLEHLAPADPSPFLRGPSADAPSAATAGPPGDVALPLLAHVGGGLAVCSPGLLSVHAPALVDIGTDLQLYAGRSWTRVDLEGLRRVRGRVFGWLDGPTLAVLLGALESAEGSLQWGGHGSLEIDLGGLRSVAALAITGSRRTTTGAVAEAPSLSVAALVLPALERASKLLELRALADLATVELPALARADRVVLTDLPGLTALSAPRLGAIAGDLEIGELTLGQLGFHGLRSVGGDVTVRGVVSPSVVLPPIEEIGGALLLQDVRARVLKVPGVVTAGSLVATGLGAVDLLEFGRLTTVTGALIVRDNIGLEDDSALPRLAADDSAVRTFVAPVLRSVGGELRISEAAFTTVRLERLATVGAGLALVNLPLLTDVTAPSLRDVGARIVVGGAPALRVLRVPGLRRAEALELVALPGLQRVLAPLFLGEIKQAGGTRVPTIVLPDR